MVWITDEEEFERELKKMMRESYEQRRDVKPVNIHVELLKPRDMLGTKKVRPADESFASISSNGNDPYNQQDNVLVETGQGEKAMEFRVMLKRGKERQVMLTSAMMRGAKLTESSLFLAPDQERRHPDGVLVGCPASAAEGRRKPRARGAQTSHARRFR